MPNGPEGLNSGVSYAFSGDPALGDTIANLPDRTQSAVEAQLKASQITDGNSVYTRTGGPFHLLHELLSVSGKGPFEALANRLGQALLDRPSHTWTTLADLLTDLGGIPATLTEHTEAIANLNDITAAMHTTQAYVGDLQDMVSAPRCLLAVTGLSARKCSDITDNYAIILGATMRATVLPVIYPNIVIGHTTGTIYYAPIVVDRHGTIGKLRWIVGADTSIFSIDYYEMALCVYNPSTHNVEKVWGSGNIADGVANTDSLQEVEVDMGLSQTVTPGQVLFVAHQQVGPGLAQSPRAFAAVPQANIGRPSSLLLDAACYSLSEYSEGIPSSVSFASLARENRYIPWAGVSVKA